MALLRDALATCNLCMARRLVGTSGADLEKQQIMLSTDTSPRCRAVEQHKCFHSERAMGV